MAYKVAYLEDLDASSIQRNIEQNDFEVIHILPQDSFEDTLGQIQSCEPDLLLMDFRLNAGTAKFNAPPFAQFFRSQVIDNNKGLPIVLISSEENIRDYYRDYTSFDLFDFAVDKETFLKKTGKYCDLFNELIGTYQDLYDHNASGSAIGAGILKAPEYIENRVDRRLVDMFALDKYQTDPFMTSSLVLTSVVKPIGMLIGEDVLSARLGISKHSEDWRELLQKFEPFQYLGLYNGTYQRWWSNGLDLWWRNTFPSVRAVRRLKASERRQLILEQFPTLCLTLVEKLDLAKSERFWTICSGSFLPIDPIDGFELTRDATLPSWVEPSFYSLDFLVNNETPEILKELKEDERARYISMTREA